MMSHNALIAEVRTLGKRKHMGGIRLKQRLSTCTCLKEDKMSKLLL